MLHVSSPESNISSSTSPLLAKRILTLTTTSRGFRRVGTKRNYNQCSFLNPPPAPWITAPLSFPRTEPGAVRRGTRRIPSEPLTCCQMSTDSIPATVRPFSLARSKVCTCSAMPVPEPWDGPDRATLDQRGGISASPGLGTGDGAIPGPARCSRRAPKISPRRQGASEWPS